MQRPCTAPFCWGMAVLHPVVSRGREELAHNCRAQEVKIVTYGSHTLCTGVAFGVSGQKPACEENRCAQSPASQSGFSDFNRDL